MKTLFKFILPFLLLLTLVGKSAFAGERNTTEWNLGEENLAILGYDPVAYFPEGGSEAKIGHDTLELNHEGVLYRFSSKANLDLFLEKPEKYEPAHGGWCSTAMSMGQKIIINPAKFVIKGSRLFLFSLMNGNDARSMWMMNAKKMERRADFNWKKVSGETPRGL